MLATHAFDAAVAAILFYPHIHLCRYHVPRTGSTTVGTSAVFACKYSHVCVAPTLWCWRRREPSHLLPIGCCGVANFLRPGLCRARVRSLTSNEVGGACRYRTDLNFSLPGRRPRYAVPRPRMDLAAAARLARALSGSKPAVLLLDDTANESGRNGRTRTCVISVPSRVPGF